MSIIKNILTISVVAGILVLHPSLNKADTPISYLQYLVYGNSFTLDLGPSIDNKAIKVLWVNEELNEELVVFEKGKNINEVPSEIGNQKLLVYYFDSYIGEIQQEKIKKYQAHQYRIKLSSKNNTVFFNGEIEGPASYKSPSITIPHMASL
ncbi:MAG: hypothetical protein H6587_08880 [Flavobacteriales bacterium]|nr:hypothetical protein [Flavobacteriales bacterium]MCB9364669.1 hypothetical protein [Flavobacteriales bacterium]